MKYRSRTDIVSQILEAASDKAHLSYWQLKNCLIMLVENNLHEFEKGMQMDMATRRTSSS
jgi:AraC-like DNA-binding protein